MPQQPPPHAMMASGAAKHEAWRVEEGLNDDSKAGFHASQLKNKLQINNIYDYICIWSSTKGLRLNMSSPVNPAQPLALPPELTRETTF